MFMRISSALVAILMIAGCDSAEEPLPGNAIGCALGGSANFVEDCTMERQDRDEASLLLVWHPDGGFRRFELGVAGQGIITADGVEPAQVDQGDGIVEVRVGGDRYRLPVAQ